ncbi:MAG: glycosyltransferase, partial [Candidatus Altiarchaeales archaeon]|nr:glycosyltransferase [Candidatus Altiarchaeales archaeon]
MLTTSFPRIKEGEYAGPFILNLCKELVKQGLDVTVLAPHHPNTKKHEVWDDVKIHRFQYFWPARLQKLCYGSGIPSNLTNSMLAKIQLPLFLFLLFIYSLKHSRSCDLIHCHWALSGLVGVVVKKITRKPVLVTLHGSDVLFLGKNKILDSLMEFIFSQLDLIVCVSHSLKEKAGKYVSDDSKINVIPNGVDLSAFNVKQDFNLKGRILFIGRLVEIKGVRRLPSIIKRINREKPEIRFELIGSGFLEDWLRSEIKKNGLGDNVLFSGELSSDEIPTRLIESDLLIIPSDYEGFGMTVLESFSTGTPVVGFSIGGLRDTVSDGVDGFLIEPFNEREFAEKSVFILENKQLRKKMGLVGRKKTEQKYSISSMAEKTKKFYHTLNRDCRGG